MQNKQFDIKEYYKNLNKLNGTDKINLDLKLQKDWDFERGDLFGGIKYTFTLANGYEVSVIKHFGSYGAKQDRWEMAIIKNNEIANVPQVFGEDIVRGWLTDAEVEQYLEQIKNLKPVYPATVQGG